jgi:hypothetical protein
MQQVSDSEIDLISVHLRHFSTSGSIDSGSEDLFRARKSIEEPQDMGPNEEIITPSQDLPSRRHYHRIHNRLTYLQYIFMHATTIAMITIT